VQSVGAQLALPHVVTPSVVAACLGALCALAGCAPSILDARTRAVHERNSHVLAMTAVSGRDRELARTAVALRLGGQSDHGPAAGR